MSTASCVAGEAILRLAILGLPSRRSTGTCRHGFVALSGRGVNGAASILMVTRCIRRCDPMGWSTCMREPSTPCECLWQEIIGEPDAGNPHVRFDEGALMPPGNLLIWNSRVRQNIIVGSWCSHQRSTLHPSTTHKTMSRCICDVITPEKRREIDWNGRLFNFHQGDDYVCSPLFCL